MWKSEMSQSLSHPETYAQLSNGEVEYSWLDLSMLEEEEEVEETEASQELLPLSLPASFCVCEQRYSLWLGLL